MKLLCLTLGVLMVLTSIAGILAAKRSAFTRYIFYILLFLFFAVAAFTLLQISLVLAVGVFPALMLFTLILLKGKASRPGNAAKTRGGEQGSENTEENR